METIFIPVDWKAINVWEETDPNLIGEALRLWSFVGRNGNMGCYDTFGLPDLFKKLEKGKYYNKAKKEICPEFGLKHCYIYDRLNFKDKYFNIEAIKLILAWEWDGDGCLYFRIIKGNKNIEVIKNYYKKLLYEKVEIRHPL